MISNRNFATICALGAIATIFFLTKTYCNDAVAFMELALSTLILGIWYVFTRNQHATLLIDSSRFVAGARRKRKRSDKDAHFKNFCYHAMYGTDEMRGSYAARGFPVYPMGHAGLWAETAGPNDIAVFTCYSTDSIVIMCGNTVFHQRWDVSTRNVREVLVCEEQPVTSDAPPVTEDDITTLTGDDLYQADFSKFDDHHNTPPHLIDEVFESVVVESTNLTPGFWLVVQYCVGYGLAALYTLSKVDYDRFIMGVAMAMAKAAAPAGGYEDGGDAASLRYDVLIRESMASHLWCIFVFAAFVFCSHALMAPYRTIAALIDWFNSRVCGHVPYESSIDSVTENMSFGQRAVFVFSFFSMVLGYISLLESAYTLIAGIPAIVVLSNCVVAKVKYQCRSFHLWISDRAITTSIKKMAPKMVTGTVALSVAVSLSLLYRIYKKWTEDKKESRKVETLHKLHNYLDGTLLVITMAKLAGGTERKASTLWRRGKFYLAMMSTAIRATRMFSSESDKTQSDFIGFVKESTNEAGKVANNVEDLDELSSELELPGCDCDTRFNQKCHCDIKDKNKKTWTDIRSLFDRTEKKQVDDDGYLTICRTFVKDHPALILISAVIIVVAIKLLIGRINRTITLDSIARVEKVYYSENTIPDLQTQVEWPAHELRGKRGAKRTSSKTAWVMYNKDGARLGAFDAGDERRNMAVTRWIKNGKGKVHYDDFTVGDQDDVDDLPDFSKADNNPLLALFEVSEGNTAPLPPASRPRKTRNVRFEWSCSTGACNERNFSSEKSLQQHTEAVHESSVKKHKKALNRVKRAEEKARKEMHEVKLKAPVFSMQSVMSLVTITNTKTTECMNAIKLCNKLVTMEHLFHSIKDQNTTFVVSGSTFEDFELPITGWYKVGNDMVARDCPSELRNLQSAKASTSFATGDDVCFFAYNVGGSGHLTTSAGKVLSISSLERDQEKAYASASTVHGNCGGAWVNGSGHIIGLHSTGSSSGNGFVPITPTVKSRIAKNENTALPDFR